MRNDSFGETLGRRAGLLLLGGLLPLAACAQASGGNTASYAAPPSVGGTALPRPRTIFVHSFTIDPRTVQLDSGMREFLNSLSKTADPAAERRRIALEVQNAISETLVAQISGMGLPAVAADAASRAQYRPGDVVVEGQIVRIDSGNATRRTLIGFGAGKSAVYADATLLQVRADGTLRPLQSYDASANSGRTPGLGVGAAGAAAGHVALAVVGSTAGTIKRARTGLAKDGETLAHHVAANFSHFFAAEGWIAPG